MNRHLEEAVLDLAKAEALLFAYESMYLGVDLVRDDEMELRAESTFYALWDAVRKATEDLDLLSGDIGVVDAIYAANEADKNRTLKKEE